MILIRPRKPVEAPTDKTAFERATQEYAGTITSSPSPTDKANKAKRRADNPDDTATACSTPVVAAHLVSSSRTRAHLSELLGAYSGPQPPARLGLADKWPRMGN